MRLLVLLARAWVIAWVFLVALLRYLGARLKGRGRSRDARDALRGEVLASALERLGATFVKFGQILGTRPDLLPEGVIRAMSRLQDAVPPSPFPEVEAVLRDELPPRARARLVALDPVPVAAASVAQVHRGELDDGTIVAVKVQRLRAASQIERDLSLLRATARVLDVLPGMRWISLPGAAERFADAIRKQLDFRLEAANNRRLAAAFAGDAHVGVPSLHPELCAGRVLTMDFIEGVKPTEVDEDRAGVAQAGFRCIAKMVFLDGFVHADMHPGNLMFTRTGKVFLIDLGLVAEIPEELRKPWVETFVAVASCDGKRAAELFYVHSPHVAVRDYRAYEADVVAHLARFAGRPLQEIEVTEAVGGAMAILRRHRVQVDPTFTVVQLAMLVAEGVGKQLDPRLDVFGCVMPFLLQAADRYPTGRAPLRQVPAPPA